MYKNDTGGTIVSDASDGTIVNTNFESTKTAEASCFKPSSAVAKTRSGGVIMSQHINHAGHSETYFAGALILGPGNSLTFTTELFAAAAGQKACVRVHGYYETI